MENIFACMMFSRCVSVQFLCALGIWVELNAADLWPHVLKRQKHWEPRDRCGYGPTAPPAGEEPARASALLWKSDAGVIKADVTLEDGKLKALHCGIQYPVQCALRIHAFTFLSTFMHLADLDYIQGLLFIMHSCMMYIFFFTTPKIVLYNI